MRIFYYFAFFSVGVILPVTDAASESPRAAAARYDTRMCHLVYKELRTGRVVHDPDAEPESYIEMLKSAAQAGNEKYPSRRYSVNCVPKVTERPPTRLSSIANARVELKSTGRVRNHPNVNGSDVLSTLYPGSILTGQWVPSDKGPGRWLRVELCSLEIDCRTWPYGYVSEINLRLLAD